MRVSMKKLLKKWSFVGLSLIFIVMTLTGCSGENKDDKTANKPEEKLYPITIEGQEILVGQTTVSALLDKGFKVTVSEMTPDKQINKYEIDPNEELEANSYYTGGSIQINDSLSALISLATDEKSVKMGDAVIARLEFTFVSEDRSYLDNIQFNGVSVNELSRDKAKEMFPDFTGDDNMWFSPASMTEYKYFLSFSWEGQLHNFYVEKKYDVDWSNKK